jgi:hypothetical protein
MSARLWRGSARAGVADFWDDVVAQWLDGQRDLTPPLDRWFASYAGTGRGTPSLDFYPDPYIGDLRGSVREPRLVSLGLNPVGVTGLQSVDGIWTRRIRETGYSRCFQRSAGEDPATFIEHHGKESVFWRNLVRFARRWLRDSAVSVHDILELELYPWRSKAVTAPIRPPADIIRKFVFAPVQEIEVPVVFAFGAPWFKVCEALELPLEAGFSSGGWHLNACRLPSSQLLIVSSQLGFAGPPGPRRVEVIRGVIDYLTG